MNLVQQEFGLLEEGHGFYEAPNSIQLVVDRRRDYFDGALPSGNATMRAIFCVCMNSPEMRTMKKRPSIW